MRKTFSIGKATAERLKKISEENNQSMSQIVETALTIFFMIQYGSDQNAKRLLEIVPKGQQQLFDVLDKNH